MHLWTLFRWERNVIRYWAFIYLFVTPDKSKKPSVLFKSVSFFLSTMAMLGITAASNCFTAGSSSVKSEVFTPKEIDSYNRYVTKYICIVQNFDWNTPSRCISEVVQVLLWLKLRDFQLSPQDMNPFIGKYYSSFCLTSRRNFVSLEISKCKRLKMNEAF